MAKNNRTKRSKDRLKKRREAIERGEISLSRMITVSSQYPRSKWWVHKKNNPSKDSGVPSPSARFFTPLAWSKR